MTGLQWMGALRPVWSPDGTWIAYFDLDAGDSQRGISVIRAEGGEPRLLVPVTEDSSDYFLPAAWSPDGKRVIFAGFEEADAIQDVAVDDGSIRTLVGNDGYEYRFPRWVTAASAPERPEAQQTPSVWSACGAGGQSEADLDLNFLRDLAAAQAAGLTVYWLGMEFTVDGQAFVGPYGEPDYGDEVEGDEISMQYISWLEGTPGRGGNVSMDIRVYSPEAWQLVKDRLLNPRVLSTEGEVTRRTVTVNGHEAEMISVPAGTRPVNAISVIVGLDTVVVVGTAGSVHSADGSELSILIKNPDLVVQVMQDLRPYPE